MCLKMQAGFKISPCVGICTVNDSVCIGCNRTSLEIQEWGNMPYPDRWVIMQRLGYGKRMGREERLRRYERG